MYKKTGGKCLDVFSLFLKYGLKLKKYRTKWEKQFVIYSYILLFYFTWVFKLPNIDISVVKTCFCHLNVDICMELPILYSFRNIQYQYENRCLELIAVTDP